MRSARPTICLIQTVRPLARQPRAGPRGFPILPLCDSMPPARGARPLALRLGDRYTGIEHNYFRFPCTVSEAWLSHETPPNGLE